MGRPRCTTRPASKTHPATGIAYWCWRGGRGHRAYLHINVGASLLWCPKHGVLASQTLASYVAGADKNETAGQRQMSGPQYDRFVDQTRRMVQR